jgi:hypothetical protein
MTIGTFNPNWTFALSGKAEGDEYCDYVILGNFLVCSLLRDAP